MQACHYPFELFDEHLAYDETSSTLLRWKTTRSPKVMAGSEAGSLNSNGYWRVRLDGKEWLLHRVVYVLAYGSIPAELEVDHLDRNKDNNKIENLEAKTPSQNCRNKARRLTRFTSKSGKKWVARFRMPVSMEFIYVGTYDTEEEAHLAAVSRRLELYWTV